MKRHLPRLVFLAGTTLFTACGADSPLCPDGENCANSGAVDPSDRDGDGLDNETEIALGTNPDVADSDGDGRIDGAEVAIGTDPTASDSACVVDSYSADLRTKPVDIIFVIDNSGSMRDEIASVERNINENFADIMIDAGLDFRVIMLSKHGTYNGLDSDICVSAPLSNTTCDPIPDSPANSARFFHYDTEIGSDDSFRKIISTYSGWSSWLRDDAFKVFIEITDDEPDGPSAARFEEQLFALQPSQFGGPGARNYVFHSITGIYPREDDATLAYTPDMDLSPYQCGTAESPGEEYQKLSIVTGGLRYPVCLFENYDVIFRAAAVKTIEDADIDCSLSLPIAPEGMRVDEARMVLEFESDSGQKRVVRQVEGPEACAADSFWVNGTTIELCPQLCPEVENTDSGTLSIVSMCNTQTCENPSPEVCGDGVDNDCDGFVDTSDLECFL